MLATISSTPGESAVPMSTSRAPSMGPETATRWPLTVFWALYSWALAAKLQVSSQPATARAVWLGVNDGLTGRFGGQNERVLAACATQRSHP